MFVDDEYNLRSMFKLVFETHFDNEEIEVLLAKDGQEALDIINDRKDNIDLVTTNILMPKIDGYSMIKQIVKKILVY